MPIEVHWHDNTHKQILVAVFTDDWTWDEYLGMFDRLKRMIQESPHQTFHQVVDMRDTTTLPEGDGALAIIQGRQLDKGGKTVGVNVLVGAPTIVQQFLKVMGVTHRQPSRSTKVKTMDEAFALIDAYNQTKNVDSPSTSSESDI